MSAMQVTGRSAFKWDQLALPGPQHMALMVQRDAAPYILGRGLLVQFARLLAARCSILLGSCEASRAGTAVVSMPQRDATDSDASAQRT